jgi:hypothetical protein
MNVPKPKRRLQVNPEPLRLVPAEHRWMSGINPRRTREQQKRVWVALGGDPQVWEDEHPQ